MPDINYDDEIKSLERRVEELRLLKEKQEREATRIRGEYVHAYYRPEREMWTVRMSTSGLTHLKQVETREEAAALVAIVDKAVKAALTE